MAIPSVNLTVVDGGLGSVSASTDRLAVVIGPCSTGTVDTPQIFTSSDDIIAAFGYGPAPALAALCIQTSGQPVMLCRATTTTPGAAGSVTHVGTGTSALTVTGAAYDRADVVVTATNNGTIGTDVIRVAVSVNGGYTSIGTYTLNVSNAVDLPTLGLTLTFGAGTVVKNDTYSFGCVEPVSDTADWGDAFDAVQAIATAPIPSLVFDAGQRDAADCGALDSLMSGAAAVYWYARLVTNADATASQAAIAADFATFTSLRVAVGAGALPVYDVTQRSPLARPFAWSVAARLVSTVAHVDAGQVSLGPLPVIVPQSAVTYFADWDQRIDPTADTARFAAYITYRGLAGYYVCNPNLMAPPGSDYTLIQYGRVMDKICRAVRGYFLQALSSSVRLSPATGYIVEKDAQALEQGCNAALRATVIADGDVSSVSTVVSRTDNISATKTIHVTVQAVPLGYLKTIDVTLSFINPANA